MRALRCLLRRIYALVPFKKWVFATLKLLWTPPEPVHKHLHFSGTISVRIPGRGKKFRMRHFGYQLENDLFWRGLDDIEERESIQWWIRLSEEADVIFDIGANTGLFSLVAACTNPGSHIYAFEPVERIHRRLCANLELNGYDVRTFPLALSDYSGDGWYFDTLTDHLYSTTVNRNLQSADTNGKKTPLKTITLDDVVRKEKLSRIDLIKIDVETHEPEVLRGFQEHLESFLPNMVIEVLTEENARKLKEILEPFPLLFYDLDEKRGIQRIPEIVRPSFRNILVCRESTAARLGLPSGPLAPAHRRASTRS